MHRNSVDNPQISSNSNSTVQTSRIVTEHQPLAPRVSYSSILLGDKQVSHFDCIYILWNEFNQYKLIYELFDQAQSMYYSNKNILT